eukprot:gnl/TRDRNA2_/TRDRNA2_85826_c0_seq1.p1 gnl/TRDRNA2_/TRDRNA2_85826_c0~~gnl/TRDRNA2_/TRDRNA2_85826_c0_seq1.p1  ORF type:complete len:660 (+),score=130.65 gnl/TRDRNA2_/TRDRNA2_85826_c0_seq1:66-2045(+)
MPDNMFCADNFDFNGAGRGKGKGKSKGSDGYAPVGDGERRSVSFANADDVVNFHVGDGTPQDPRIKAAESGGGAGYDPEVWRKTFLERARMYSEISGNQQQESPPAGEDNMDPDSVPSYPPPRPPPNTQSSPFDEGTWEVLYGTNAPVMKPVEPLPPCGPIFFFRVVKDARQVYAAADTKAKKIGKKEIGEVVRVADFSGAWVRLAPETEAQADGKWQGWMLQDDPESGERLLEEIEDPLENEKEYTKQLLRRIWKVNDHIKTRIADKSLRSRQYQWSGRLSPGDKLQLPEGTRILNAFWGLEVRYVKLAVGEEYWPQGCINLQAPGWECPSEEARAGHWRVFAARPFGHHELIEVCPLVEADLSTCLASMPLRMNLLETPVTEEASGAQRGFVKNWLPLGYGMLYQQSIELEDVQINWKSVKNFNCKYIAVGDHMYIYATRRIEADEELVLRYQQNFRTDQGEAIDFEGFTPYWCRPNGLPENFAKALKGPVGPRKVRPIPGHAKFGKSQLHARGVFADANYKKGEIVEICPCLFMDTNGADCMKDYCFRLPPVKVDLPGGRQVVKRNEILVLPLGLGGMYNHLPKSDGQNVQWYYDESTQCMVWVADQKDGEDIVRNQELCFDYGSDYWNAPGRQQRGPNFTGTNWAELGLEDNADS